MKSGRRSIYSRLREHPRALSRDSRRARSAAFTHACARTAGSDARGRSQGHHRPKHQPSHRTTSICQHLPPSRTTSISIWREYLYKYNACSKEKYWCMVIDHDSVSASQQEKFFPSSSQLPVPNDSNKKTHN